jgi:hypothetical protein
MSEQTELKLLEEIEKLQKEIEELKGTKTEAVPTLSFSKVKDNDLENFLEIKQKFDRKRFDFWFNSKIDVSENDIKFLENLIDENLDLISIYHEEDLKINFIAPLLKRVNFFILDKEIRNFYDEKLFYKTDNFIFKGEADFIVSKGIRKAEKPYFFIQEFKRAEDYSNPRPQLLAEMVAGLEISKFLEINGAYVIGENWNFVILEKISENNYIYFISRTFNSSNILDLKEIFKNLLFIKNQILEKENL